METPEEWAFSYFSDETEAANAAGMAASDALLLGRVTYEGPAAYWPHQPSGDPMVDHINSVPKFVALDAGHWPMLSASDELVSLLDDVASNTAGVTARSV